MKKTVFALIVLVVILTVSVCPAFAMTQEEVLQAAADSAGNYEPGAPLTEADFICFSTDSDFIQADDNVLTYLKNDRWEWVFVYPWTPLTPENERYMYYTNRGILIEDYDKGDRAADATKAAVLSRYGVGLAGNYDPKQDTIAKSISKKASKEAMGKSVTWLVYNYQDVGQIKFYFDSDDMVNAVAWFRGIQETADKETTQRIQEYLNENGYDCGTPDGVAGKKTKAMLAQFQKDHGLFASGVIDDGLMKFLDAQQ